jgi:molybdenum cofactor biosynthesis protein B
MNGPAQPIPLNIAVLTVSDTRTLDTDQSGQILAERLQAEGHRLADRGIVADDIYRIRAAVSAWIADPAVHIVITTGGTGVTGRDGTPEAVAPLLDKILEGFGEVFRAVSFQEIGTSTIQSRALAGVANGTYLFCLPGSASACRTAWDRLLRDQLDSRTRPCNLAELLPRLKEAHPA